MKNFNQSNWNPSS